MGTQNRMKVIKRSGIVTDMLFDKVTKRINGLCVAGPHGPALDVQADKVAQKVFSNMYDGVRTSEIDDLSAEVAVHTSSENPDYETLATRIVVSNMHKTSPMCFSDAMIELHKKGIVSDKFMKDLRIEYDGFIDHVRDYDFGFFGMKTLQKSYLNPGETPQYMFMRVAVAIHGTDLTRVRETYDLMSRRYFIHATPTLFNAGSKRPQMSSCFLLDTEDSIDGIYDTIKKCAQISKWSGGIGLAISKIRSNGSRVVGTNGHSDGIIPMLRVYNSTARFVNQGSRRKGSIAPYLEPWHADIMEFLELRLNQGDEEARCRDLFTALWIPDLFMKKVEADEDWHLMCPNECPGLDEVHGEAFDELYRQYVAQGRFRKVVRARAVWDAVLKSQVETGTPYMCYKDAANAKSNQQNLGTIKSSNLCTEIIEFTNKDEVAVCNLASLSLPAYVTDGEFNHAKLHEVTRVVTRNLNRVIDTNFYPVEEALRSNFRHRPIAIGVQGLADVFMMLGLAYDEPAARKLNTAIFETMYHAALTESCELAKVDGAYSTFRGSPASKGVLQCDLWGVTPADDWDWKELREDIQTHGLRNSLLVGPMPTASTAQILGNNEAFEPYTTNLYLRRTLAGEFVVINKHLVKDLTALGLWNKDLKNEIVRDGGSVQNLTIPDVLKARYRTAWEISQKSVLDMSADRGAYVCQSQSLNIFMENPTMAKLSSMHMHGWKIGLKTGMYYLRTRAKARAQQVTVPILACSRDNPDCAACSA
jgi:ribonucleoside-diphosphate reductase alpha subunit